MAWAGFTIGPATVKPLHKHTEAVRTYPTPVNITDMMSFMALLHNLTSSGDVQTPAEALRTLEMD